jgi:hypothetical protein
MPEFLARTELVNALLGNAKTAGYLSNAIVLLHGLVGGRGRAIVGIRRAAAILLS